MTHVKRILPKITAEGTLIVPETAWQSLIRKVREHFDAVLEVHDHDGPGAFHGYDFEPVAHYLLRLSVADPMQLDRVIEAINTRLDEFVETYTEANVPAGR